LLLTLSVRVRAPRHFDQQDSILLVFHTSFNLQANAVGVSMSVSHEFRIFILSFAAALPDRTADDRDRNTTMHRLIFGLALALVTATAALAQPVNNPGASKIGYPTVAAALEGVRARSGVQVSNQGGFTVITEPATQTLWTFTPAGHPAHPAAVRRAVVKEGDDIFIEMDVKCEAAKPACDALVAEFHTLNDRIRENLNRGRAR
jgi:hypothetical protein